LFYIHILAMVHIFEGIEGLGEKEMIFDDPFTFFVYPLQFLSQ